jgi:hypothetical protein
LSDRNSKVLGLSRTILRTLRVLNLILGLIVVVAFPASFIFEPVLREYYSNQGSRMDASTIIPSLRLMFVLGVAVLAASHILLSRLLAIVETVRAGDPFVPENAARLKTIAWCMLVSQLVHLAFGVMAAKLRDAGADIDWTFSGSGWVAVMLLFVLARVFEEGTRMRADLETMV